jgi:hypothetical protein
MVRSFVLLPELPRLNALPKVATARAQNTAINLRYAGKRRSQEHFSPISEFSTGFLDRLAQN